MRLGRAIGRAILAAAMIFTAGILLSPGKGTAAILHNEYPDMETECDNCHTLNDALDEPATTLIRSGVRTLPTMKSLNSSLPPEYFGCTFCHANTGRTTYMRDALEHFSGKTSQHPVDRAYSWDDNTYRNISLLASSNNTRWMSNWDASWTAKPANQINCIDCHQMDGKYPNHPSADNVLRSGNPVMLKGGNASWDNSIGHASNAFCLAVCHAGTAPGTSAYRMGHYGWGGFKPADNTIREPSGTPLGVQRCVDCHESHYTASALNLVGELGGVARTSASASTNLIEPSNCTNICHSASAFQAQGHGRFPLSGQCGSCHNVSNDPASGGSHRNATHPTRLTNAETPPPTPSLTDNLVANGLDDDYNGVVDNPEEAAVKKSSESICTGCHQDYVAHGGDIQGAPSHAAVASCLFCHDPHGKSVNNGTDNNIMMIRGKILGKTTRYVTANTSLWRADGSGVCDNQKCHGGKPMGDNALASGTVMGDVADHKSAGVTYTTSCVGCHTHTTASGSFKPDCNSCHEYPGQQYLSGTHVLSAVHKVHAFSPNPTNGYDNGYGFSCGTCHNSYTHNKLTWGPGTWDNNATVVDVVFDPAKNPGATYDNSLPGAYTGTCNGLTCHGGKLPAASQGTDTTPEWQTRSTGACGTCHKVTAAGPPGTGAHPDHASSVTGYAIGCNVCHYQTTTNGTTIANRSVHTDNQSRVSFNTSDWRFTSAGSAYGGTLAIGDSAVDSNDRCTNVYCHSVANSKTAPYGGVVQTPQWDNTAPLACNGCHENPPSYAGPKANTHPKHSAAPAGFSCQVCHWATTENGSSIPQAKKASHVNGSWDAVSEGDPAANPGATPKQQSHNFAYDNALTCGTAACHGGTSPVWGAAGPIACDVCHKNTNNVPSTADVDDFNWDNGVMPKIRDSEWTTSGHGRTSGSYASGRSPANFTSCTNRCHSTAVSHNAANNPFRLIDNAANTDFNDTFDPRSFKDNKVCLDCHSAAGATPSGSTLHVEENHFGKKHGGQDHGGSFCWDCHDPHGDPSNYMIRDNVTRVSDAQYGVPVTRVGTSFSKTNLNGEAYNSVYDWGDYVKNTSPYSGICQVCHSYPAGPSGGTTGGAAFFNDNTYTANHNKAAGQGQRCTDCHFHTADFAPSCNFCHGSSDLGSGAPPYGPSVAKPGLNQLWSASVDNVSSLAGVGNHRSFAGYVDNSSHDPWMGATTACIQCHTATPGSGTHNLSGLLNAPMDNIASHDWYNGAQASFDNGGTTGTTNVVDDGCSNVDCHSPYYGATPNQYRSGTPMPYKRYWVNKTLWDCYTCHAYDGRTGVGSRQRPGGADNTMATGAHGEHVGTSRIDCSRCHNVTGYGAPTFGFGATAHKNGVLDWSFAGAPNPTGYPATPSNAYSFTSGLRAPTDDNTAAGALHPTWGNCSNIYCHSIVQTATGGVLTPGAGYATASWDNAATGQCGTCHAGDGVSGNLTKMASGSHAQHLVSGYAMTCDACHTGSGTAHATHSDGIIQVPIGDNAWRVFTLTAASTVFDRATAPGVDNANKTPGAARGRCSNVACHTDGRSSNPLVNPPRVSPAVWGDNQAAATNCTYCHGGNSASGASMATNAHGKHVAFGYLCSSCHADTVAAGADNVLNANVGKGASLHVDNQVQVINGNGYTFAWNGGTRDCTNISCHGGNAANWVTGVGALKCGSCHLANAADSDQYQTASGTWFSNDNIATLYSTEWAYSGHGKAGASYDVSGHPAADFTGGAGSGDPCWYCHDPGSTHRQASNPFRLIRQDNVVGYETAGWNATCLICHRETPAPAGYGTVYGFTSKIGVLTDRVDTAHYGTKHASDNTSGGRFCWDCHDAHGDRVNSSTGNIYMIQSRALAKTDGVYGFRGSAGELTAAVTFKKDNTVAGNLGDWANASGTGLCQVCHHGDGTGSATQAKFYTPTAFQNHNQDKVCTTCHEHDKNFRASCNSCHGEATGGGTNGSPPYAPWDGNNPWPSRATVDNVNTPAGIGNHRAVPAAGIDNSSHGSYDCTECHTSTPGSGGSHDNALEANATMTALLARKWTDGSTATTWTARNAGRTVTTGSVVDDTCNNVNCHSPYFGGNAAKSATPFPYERYWENQTMWDCYTCHAYTADGDTMYNPGNLAQRAVTVPIATGSHKPHLYDFDYRVPCSACHNVTGYSATTWPNTNANHKDGLVQVPIAGTLGAVTLAGSYSVSPAQSPTDNVSRPWGTCQTVYCHSTVQTSPPSGSSRTYFQTPQWGAGSASIVCGSCHKAGVNLPFHLDTGVWIDTGSHTVHAQTKQYRCTTCHQYPGQLTYSQSEPSRLRDYAKCGGCHPSIAHDSSIPNRHADGYINVRFGDIIGPDNIILSGVFDNNGDHVNDNVIVPGAPYGTCESVYCHGTGTTPRTLTGGANQYPGTPNIPKWGDVNTSKCGSCHGAPGGTTNYPGKSSNYPTSGAHAIHMDNTSMAGPRIAACTDCHRSNVETTHSNGVVDLRTSYLDNSAASLENTSTCNPCHGLGAPAAKANWASAGALDCLTCHMTGSLANSKADMSGVSAPNVGGDNATYGSYFTGHNRTSGQYVGSLNTYAGRGCADCHDLAQRHINHANDNSYLGNRLTATVPWNSVSTGNTIAGLCAACHTTTATPSASHKKINTHGNTNFSGINHDTAAETFAYSCEACHDAHGMTLNERNASAYNIYMIKPYIGVGNFTTPGGPNSKTTGPVYFETKQGAYSFDDNASTKLNRLCVTCHESGDRPGSSTLLNVTDHGGSHSGTPGADYTTDERTKDCSACHNHNKDDNTASVDGLMPQQCNGCHSYPGLDNSAALYPNQRQMSSGHFDHAGRPVVGTANSHGFPCTVCHLNYQHNESNIAAGGSWATFNPNTVDIRFDASWCPVNAIGPRYNGALADPANGTVGIGGTGVCAGLYCHGGNATSNVGWGGTDNAPIWGSALGCGACHAATATTLAQGNHPVHMNNAANPRGPVGLTACTSCHIGYGLSPDNTHVNKAADFRISWTDNSAARPLSQTQVCGNCHTTYTSANVLNAGDNLARSTWGNTSYRLPCVTCHNNAPDANAPPNSQGRANGDGSGNRAHNIEGMYYSSGHGKPGPPAPLPLTCDWCHDPTMGHIASARPIATNPWRISISDFNKKGRVDQYCATDICHTSLPPNDHTWRVDNTDGYAEIKETSDTHPTTVLAVGAGSKTRWYQIPSNVNIPLLGNLIDNNYNKTLGDNNYVVCVSCHDPHGIGTAELPASVRNFSGLNTDAKGNKMLRFNYSTGIPTVLCSHCHK